MSWGNKNPLFEKPSVPIIGRQSKSAIDKSSKPVEFEKVSKHLVKFLPDYDDYNFLSEEHPMLFFPQWSTQPILEPLNPFDSLEINLPAGLQKIEEIQQSFLSYDSKNDENTKYLVDFIDSHSYFGLKELEICSAVRPNKAKDYIHLFSHLSTNTKRIAQLSLTFPSFFELLLQKAGIFNIVETSQISTPINSYHFSDRLNFIFFENALRTTRYEPVDYDCLNALIEDDIQYFVDLAMKGNINSFKSFGKFGATIIQFAAYFGAVNCFKYFMCNKGNLDNIERFALAGGNTEIIRILMQQGKTFDDCLNLTLLFRRDELYEGLLSNCDEEYVKRQSYTFYLTDSMSIRAIYALMQTNRVIAISDYLSVLFFDGFIDACRELSVHALYSKHLFSLMHDDVILGNFLNNCPSNTAFEAIFKHCFTIGAEYHLKIMIDHEKFKCYKLSSDLLSSVENKMPQITEYIKQKTQAATTVEDAYLLLKNGNNPNSSLLFDVMMYCVHQKDPISLNSLFQKVSYHDVTIQQMQLLMKEAPWVRKIIQYKYVHLCESPTDFIPFVRYFGYDIDPPIADSRFLADPEVLDSLTIFDWINISIIYERDYQDIVNYCKSIDLIDHDEERYPLHALLETDEFNEKFKKNYEDFINCIYVKPSLIKYYESIEISADIFNKLIDFYDMVETIEIEQFFLLPKMKKFLNIAELCKNNKYLDILVNLEYTAEEFEIVKNTGFMKNYLLCNLNNAKFMTINEIFNSGPSDLIINALLVIDLDDEKVRQVHSMLLTRHIDRQYELLNRQEYLKGLPTTALLKYCNAQNDEIIIKKVIAEVLSRDLTHEEEKLITTLNLPKSIINEFRPLMSEFILFVYTVRYGYKFYNHFEEISDDDFLFIYTNIQQMYSDTLLSVKVSKNALTRALHIAIQKKNIHLMIALLNAGAYIDGVVNNLTPLQLAINCRFVQGIQVLIEAGSDISFRLTSTAAQQAHNASFEIIKIINDNSDINVEAKYSKIIPEELAPKMKQDLFEEIQSFTIYGDFDFMDMNEIEDPQELANFALKYVSKFEKFSQILGFLLLIKPNIQPFELLMTKYRKFRAELSDETREFVWNFISSRINEQNAQVKNVYSALTGIDLISNHPDNSLLLYAATKGGFLNIVQSLFDHGANLNEVEGNFFTLSPALEAITMNRPDIFKVFIGHGLDVNSVYPDNFTLINYSILKNNQEIFDMILPKCNFKHLVIYTPMMVAMSQYQTNPYHATVLYDKIDRELERIENDNFHEYELFVSGESTTIPNYHVVPYQVEMPERADPELTAIVRQFINSHDFDQRTLIYRYIVTYNTKYNTVRKIYWTRDSQVINPIDDLIDEYDRNL